MLGALLVDLAAVFEQLEAGVESFQHQGDIGLGTFELALGVKEFGSDLVLARLEFGDRDGVLQVGIDQLGLASLQSFDPGGLLGHDSLALGVPERKVGIDASTDVGDGLAGEPFGVPLALDCVLYVVESHVGQLAP